MMSQQQIAEIVAALKSIATSLETIASATGSANPRGRNELRRNVIVTADMSNIVE